MKEGHREPDLNLAKLPEWDGLTDVGSPPEEEDKIPPATRFYTVLLLLLIGAYALVLAVVPTPSLLWGVALAILIGNLCCIPVLIRRGLRSPSERLGWFGFAGAQAIAFLANAMLSRVVMSPSNDHGVFLGGWILLMTTLALLQCWSLLHWPWSHRQPVRFDHHLVASALFAVSLLLLYWAAGIVQYGGILTPFRAIQTGNMVRSALVAGVVFFLIFQDPRRVRGALGFVLAFVLQNILSCFLGDVFLHPTPLLRGLMATSAPGPYLLLIPAVTDLPVVMKGRARKEGPRILFLEALIYAPFILSGALLSSSASRQVPDLLWPFLGFLLVATLQLCREMLILDELRVVNARLEAKVEARTQALEQMQSVVLQTERLNTQALLSAGLTHDINNFHAAALTNLQLLQENLDPADQAVARRVGNALEATRKASAMSQRILAVGRSVDPTVRVGDARKHLESFSPVLQMLLGSRSRLIMELPAGSIFLAIASDQLEQILVNLVSNAKDAMPRGGEVRISLSRSNAGTGAITVSDTGDGIALEDQEKLFSTYFTTKAPGKGTGLGLASIKLIIEQAGGTIAFRSEPGQGTTFFVELPMLEAV